MLNEDGLSAALKSKNERQAAAWVMEAVAQGAPLSKLGRQVVRLLTPHLELCAQLPFPTRSLDRLFATSRAVSRLKRPTAALVLGRMVAEVAAGPLFRSRRSIIRPPSIEPEDVACSLSGAISRADIPLSRSLLAQLMQKEQWVAPLGQALVQGTYGDAFQGGEKMLVAIAAWSLSRQQEAVDAHALVDKALPYIASEPQDLVPKRAFEAIAAGQSIPALEPNGLEWRWLKGMAKGLLNSQPQASLPRLLNRKLLKTLAGWVLMPEVANGDQLAYVNGLLQRSLANLPEALRPLLTALREGDRKESLPLVTEVLAEGRGYGRVLRIAALVGAERMLTRRYQWGFGMAQDIRLCHGSALMAERLGAKYAMPAVMLTAYIVGRGGSSVESQASVELSPPPKMGRQEALEALEAAMDARDFTQGRLALSGVMNGVSPISQVNRLLLEKAAQSPDIAGIMLPYVQACVEVAEHMPRLDAELVLGAALSYLVTCERVEEALWLLELRDKVFENAKK